MLMRRSPRDRLTTVTPPSPASAISYTWDDNGNLTDRGSDSFSWDYEDRMVSATVNSVTTSFAYRGDGLRDSRTTGMTTTTFTWDIASGLPVVLDDGNQYVYGAGLAAMKQSGNWYYYLADGLGSTMAIVDASDNSQKTYQFDVYGEVTVGSGSLSNEFDFAGQQTDATGLQYLRARYYDPATGTFLSRDPLAQSPLWVFLGHLYAEGAPTLWSDPAGLCVKFIPCPDIIESFEDLGVGACWMSGVCTTLGIGQEVRKALCRILGTCPETIGPDTIVILSGEYSTATTGDGRTLDDILKDDALFKRWLKSSKDVKRPYNEADSQNIWEELKRRYGDRVRCDATATRPGSVWKADHINIAGQSVHIPVAKGFCAGKGR